MTARNLGVTTPSVDHLIALITAGTADGSTCTPDLAEAPWVADTTPGYGPGSSMGDVIPVGSPRQGALERAPSATAARPGCPDAAAWPSCLRAGC